MLARPDADHEETAPQAAAPLIQRLACPLVGRTQTIRLMRGTKLHRAYGADEATEQFRCSFGLNPAHRSLMLSGHLQCAGVDPQGEVRAVELATHRFFLATLFLPQLASRPGAPHPLITAYLLAAAALRSERTGNKPIATR